MAKNESFNLNIDNLTTEQKAELTRKLAESNSILSRQENSVINPELAVSSSQEGSLGNLEGSEEVNAGASTQAHAEAVEAGKVVEIPKAKGILNRFFDGKESFDDLNVTAANAAQTVEEMEELARKKAA